MVGRGRGCRDGGQGDNQLPPAFDQQVFMEAISVEIATIAHASATTGKGGLSNLQRFKTHHPLTFKGGGDSMIADHWFRQVNRILEAIKVTYDATQIRLVTF